MKFLSLAALFLVSTAVKAGTVESANPSTSRIKISGVEFEYRVSDNGVRISGNIYPGPTKFESTRDLVLEYTALTAVSTSMRTDLLTDAWSRCQAFGEAELADQSRAVETKFVVRDTTELGSSIVDETNPLIWGRFVCRARVTAEETSK